MCVRGLTLVRGIALAALALPLAAAESTAPDAPHVLPKISINANVPLQKVGEFHLRTARTGAAVVAAGDYLYIIGGANAANRALDSIERFDVRTGLAEEFARLAVGRRWHRAVLAGDKIYILGGSARPISRPSSFKAVNSERSGLNIPVSVELDDALPVSSVEILDLKSGQVTGGPNLPEPRNEFACVVAAGKLYVIGGQGMRNGGPRCTNLTAVLDLATHTWSQGPLLPTARESQAVLVDDNFIVVPGGYDGTKAVDTVEVLNVTEQVWRTLPPLAQPMSAHSLVYHGHFLFLFGNYDTPGDLLAYDLKTKTSEAFALGYAPARHSAAIEHQGKIYVVGGRSGVGGDTHDLIQVFIPTGK